MKTFLSAIALLAFATALTMGGCSSDDSSPPATTNPGNVPNGAACTQGVECQSGTCGYAIAKACTATAGICIVQSTCAVRTQCPCGGGPAFDECDDGVNAGQAVTGNQSCVVADAGPVVDSALPGTDAADASDAGNDASNDSGGDAGSDSGDAALD